ncbi:hypothetical protein N482_18215 [Pseudoalteromonas luteoviolacea NCIMB 1942]|uniref:LysR substrate-binding domain-containing protein n=1 Tax=Pseudoalteromonas luteoviolacea NCIMB 1942 TaxID=1365253 RepID=A0A166Z5W6_9GAMM|nr:hypothetical protein N482_18215 [Pseudoalteromonas luteoviolacea NCIMB 1942]
MHLWDILYSDCAHHAYIEKHGLNPNKVTAHQKLGLPCVIAYPVKQWLFVDKSSNEVMLSPLLSLVVNDLGLAYHGVLTGQYIAMLLHSMIKSDDLLKLTVDTLAPRTRVMYAYYFGKKHIQSQIKQLVGYIKKDLIKAFNHLMA